MCCGAVLSLVTGNGLFFRIAWVVTATMLFVGWIYLSWWVVGKRLRSEPLATVAAGLALHFGVSLGGLFLWLLLLGDMLGLPRLVPSHSLKDSKLSVAAAFFVLLGVLIGFVGGGAEAVRNQAALDRRLRASALAAVVVAGGSALLYGEWLLCV